MTDLSRLVGVEIAPRRVPGGPNAAAPLLTAFLLRYQNSDASQRAVLDALKRSARGLGVQPQDLAWWELQPTHCALIRTYLLQFSPATGQHSLSILRALFRECWRQRLIDRDTLDRLCDVQPIRGSREGAGRALTDFECEELYRVVMASETFEARRAGAIFELGYGCGLRRAEIARVPFAAFSPENGQLRIIGKGNKERIVPVPDGARRLLERWLTTRGRISGPLVCTRRGRALSSSGVRRAFARLCKAAGIHDVAPHDFRRSYATALLKKTNDLVSVQRLLGHSSPATTSRYDRRDAAERAAVADQLPILGR